MHTEPSSSTPTSDPRYARSLENSRRIRWDIDKDVFRGRELDFSGPFLPDGLSLVSRLGFLTSRDARVLSQIQGRTYANVFGLVERFINAKVLELSRRHWLGDQTALEALVGFSQEELKHQEMFRRVERMIAAGMPAGYTFLPRPDDVASVVLGKSTWAVLALTYHIELFTQVHYLESIKPDATLSSLFKDVFLFHWKDESQHVTLDEVEWTREDGRVSAAERDRAVDDFIALVGAVDGILQAQAAADAAYFLAMAEGPLDAEQRDQVGQGILRAYRWQHILSGAQHPRFLKMLLGMITQEQAERVTRALAPIAA
ncbi:MAG TPA: hypothetical protein VEJ89_16345 [Myxococcaceae bacterium]|jgi:hypothetical protein|nr:hypothetical protein [Myxococcaceae bacterium]